MSMINQDTARSIVKSLGDNSRSAIMDSARKLRADIAQAFADAEHWNRVNVPWRGPAIDPDPDGQLERIAAGLDRMLAAEAARAKCGPTLH